MYFEYRKKILTHRQVPVCVCVGIYVYIIIDNLGCSNWSSYTCIVNTEKMILTTGASGVTSTVNCVCVCLSVRV